VKTLLVIFGVTGDLSTRKLLPALGNIVDKHDVLDLHLLGVSRHTFDIGELVMNTTSNAQLSSISKSITMDVASLGDYQKLKQAIHAYDADQTLIYLAVPPGAAAQIVDLLGEAGINTPDVRLLFEKPFGFDLESAKDFITRTARYFTEEQTYRIDHYMAKEVAAELVRLRRSAEVSQRRWCAETVESVTIVASEKIGIEGRAQFYEQTGALRDFVQGHLMQLLSLVLMPQATINDELPKQRLKALEQLKTVPPNQSVRGQYEGYQEEVENPGSTTETFVALELESSDPEWRGVPLRLVTGKALDEKRSYIEIKGRDGTVSLFEEGAVQATTEDHRLDAYERVLLGAIHANEELFTSGEEVLEAWRILASVQEHWAMDSTEIKQYPRGANYTAVFSR
jgi:glucose-6-phosphate 1-dehydrogenase